MRDTVCELSLRQDPERCDDYAAFCHDDNDQCCDCLGETPIRRGGVGDEDNDGCYLRVLPCCLLGILLGEGVGSNDTSGCADEAVYCSDDNDHCCRCAGINPIRTGGPGDEDKDGCFLKFSVCCIVGEIIESLDSEEDTVDEAENDDKNDSTVIRIRIKINEI
ncbi:hypothetical protein Avbf_12558 [Armadillidium vulgare]|nr:hypothetical protein Avbf_12558 [Armadillidium vulgare]